MTDDLTILIEKARKDLAALEKLDAETGKKNIQAQQLRRQLETLQARLEANDEQQKAA